MGSDSHTGGNLVFSGGTNDRMFRAFDAATGAVLWEFATNSGMYVPPTSFMVNQKQYIAVAFGLGTRCAVDASAYRCGVARQLP